MNQTTRHGVSPRLALLGAAFATLTACSRPATPASTIEVHGVVVSEGTAVGGATVAIPGVGSTTTAGDGTFVVAGVAPPYDVGISVPSSGAAVFFRSLRSASPRLPLPWSQGGTKVTAYVSGTLSGGESYPQPADHRTDVCLDADTRYGSPGSPGGLAPGTYLVGRSWANATTIPASLQGIQYVVDAATGITTDYLAYGHVDDLTLTAGTTIADQVLPLAVVTKATLTGTVNVPGGYTVSRKRLEMGCLRLTDDFAADTSFAYPTPNVSGSGLTLDVNAQDGGAEVTSHLRGLAPDATGVSVALPPAIVPASPPQGATLVDSTTVFSWSQVPGGTYALLVQDVSGNSLLTIVTSDTSTTLPDASIVGVAIPRGTVLRWKVGAIAPLTMDDVVARGTVEPTSDWSETVSGALLFSTAP